MEKIKSYIYDNEDILAEFDEEGLFEKYYVHGMGIDNPLAMLDNEFENGRDNFTAYYYHKDGMNSITSLTDKDGKEVENYVYNAFGKMTIYDERDNKLEESQFDNPYSFTGREHDIETGLHYHRARYYSPELARWISEDPIEFNGENLNLYRYTLNNPLYWTDPDGEIVFLPYIVYTGGALALGCAITSFAGGGRELLQFRQQAQECANKIKDPNNISKLNFSRFQQAGKSGTEATKILTKGKLSFCGLGKLFGDPPPFECPCEKKNQE